MQQYYYWDYTIGVAFAALVFFAGAGAANFAAPATSSPNSTYAIGPGPGVHGLGSLVGGNELLTESSESFGPAATVAASEATWVVDAIHAASGNATPAAQNRTSLYAIDP